MTPDNGAAYLDLLTRWGRNEPITTLEFVIATYTGRGKAARKAAAQLAEMQQTLSDQARKIEQLQQELNGHGR